MTDHLDAVRAALAAHEQAVEIFARGQMFTEALVVVGTRRALLEAVEIAIQNALAAARQGDAGTSMLDETTR